MNQNDLRDLPSPSHFLGGGARLDRAFAQRVGETLAILQRGVRVACPVCGEETTRLASADLERLQSVLPAVSEYMDEGTLCNRCYQDSAGSQARTAG